MSRGIPGPGGAAAASRLFEERTVDPLERLLERIPLLAISGDDGAVDLILYEILTFLASQAGADIGQINLLPRGGRVEKLCIVKDGTPWLKKGVDLHLFDPSRGFTGVVMATGEPIVAADIWAERFEGGPNPFLALAPAMSQPYLREIKEPVSSTMIVPIKSGSDIFCTVELSRYRGRPPLGEAEKDSAVGFATRYGALIMHYVLDVRLRVDLATAHAKLLNVARIVASNQVVDHRGTVEAYRKLSSADLGFAFFRTGCLRESSYAMVAWNGEVAREVLLTSFIPSGASILRDDPDLAYPIEGTGGDARILRFCKRIREIPGLKATERRFVLRCLAEVQSYVVYPLHMLSQDLGALVLGSRRPQFWRYLYMNPFLSLYNSLLKSFLLNERAGHLLSDIGRRVHNPGFYCLGALKGALASRHPSALQDEEVTRALGGIETLLGDLHEEGRALKWRRRRVLLTKWVRAYLSQKSVVFPGVRFDLVAVDPGPSVEEGVVLATDEQLETLFENLTANSLRAIGWRQRDERSLVGKVSVLVARKRKRLLITFQDNGAPYATVSGRGLPQMQSVAAEMGATLRRQLNPYQTYLSFPCTEGDPPKGDSP